MPSCRTVITGAIGDLGLLCSAQREIWVLHSGRSSLAVEQEVTACNLFSKVYVPLEGEHQRDGYQWLAQMLLSFILEAWQELGHRAGDSCPIVWHWADHDLSCLYFPITETDPLEKVSTPPARFQWQQWRVLNSYGRFRLGMGKIFI